MIDIDSKNRNFLSITFPFNQKIIEAVKSLPGRSYNVKSRMWRVHVDHVDKVVDNLNKLGIKHTPQVEALRLKILEKQRQNLILKSSKSAGEGLFSDLPLFDFQKIGATMIRDCPSLLLADVPGLGKSIQTIAGLKDVKEPILIFCPASLKYSWKAEIEKWDPGASVYVINGSREERSELWKTNIYARYYIVNYELLLRHDYDFMVKRMWGAIVCDEATRISNPRAVTVRALKTLKSEKRIALTGTPVSNSPQDLWGIMDFVRPGLLGGYTWFKEVFTVSDEWGRVVEYQNLRYFSTLIDPYILRRTKEEVFDDFPPKVIENVSFDLSPVEEKLYKNVKSQIYEDLEGQLNSGVVENLGMIPVKMLRLKQITDHPMLVTDAAEENQFKVSDGSKFQTLLDLLEDIVASGEKTIVFSQFARMAELLKGNICAHIGGHVKPMVFLIEGDTPVEDRQKYVDAFNGYEGAAIMVMTEAGAMGLNMQSASYVIHYDFPWSIAKLMQREDRAHRIGQKKSVTVYNLIAKNTIDEYVIKTLYKKQKVSVQILKDAERMEAQGLGVEDIKSILRI